MTELDRIVFTQPHDLPFQLHTRILLHTPAHFLAEILDASEKGLVTVVLTLRGDFFGQALSDRSFADRLQGAQVNL